MDSLTVKMISCSAGPEGNLDAGKVYELPREKANALIQGGYASLVSVGAATRPETLAPVETAAGRRGVENAGGAAAPAPADKVKAKSKAKGKGGQDARSAE